MRPLMTAVDGEGSIPPSLECLIQTAFKDTQLANDIHSQLVEMEFGLEELLLMDDNDLDEICSNMNLNGTSKIKFKILVRKQKKMREAAQPKHIVTITKVEQAQTNKIDTGLKNCEELHHLFEIYFNEIEQHALTTTSAVNQQFDDIFKALQMRQKILNNKIAEWKLSSLEQVNNKVSNIVKNIDGLKQLKENIDVLLLKHNSPTDVREKNIIQITQKFLENNQYYNIFNDVKLLDKYLIENTKLLGVDFKEKISMNKLHEFGIVNVDNTNMKYKLPSISLSNIIKIEEGYRVRIQWAIKSIEEYNDNKYTIFYMECGNNTNNDDEKKESYVRKTNEQWEMINNIKIQRLSRNKFFSDISKFFGYNKVYKFKIECIFLKPLTVKVISNIKDFSNCMSEKLVKYSAQEQRKYMKKLGIKIQIVGDYWYPIDKKWYDSWVRYTMFDKEDDDIPGGIDKLHEIGEPRPGKIDNSDLQDPSTPQELKRDIHENRTHVWIHEDVWKLLKAWYGGGPEFPRKVYERGSSYAKEKYICIYPQLVKLVYCDDKTGEINVNKQENIQRQGFPPDYTLKQMAKDLEDAMEWKDDKKEDTPYVHIWLKFGQVKVIYPIDKPNAKVTDEDIEKEDMERWVEIPDDYLRTKLDGIAVNNEQQVYGDIIVIERKQHDDTWPRAKGDNWRETLLTGDFIDAKDEAEKWYESLVRYVYPFDHPKLGGKCIVHYIGWNLKWNKPLLIFDKNRLAKRHQHTKGPHRPKPKLKTVHN